jgi:hypothetical protein
LDSNNLSLALDDGLDAEGKILNGHVVTASIAVAVKSLYGETGKLKDGLTQRLARNRASVNAHATDHDDVVD